MLKPIPGLSATESGIYHELAKRINLTLNRRARTMLPQAVHEFVFVIAKHLGAINNYTQLLAANTCYTALHGAKVQRRTLRVNNFDHSYDTLVTLLDYAQQEVRDTKRPILTAAITANEILDNLCREALLLPSSE